MTTETLADFENVDAILFLAGRRGCDRDRARNGGRIIAELRRPGKPEPPDQQDSGKQQQSVNEEGRTGGRGIVVEGACHVSPLGVA